MYVFAISLRICILLGFLFFSFSSRMQNLYTKHVDNLAFVFFLFVSYICIFFFVFWNIVCNDM